MYPLRHVIRIILINEKSLKGKIKEKIKIMYFKTIFISLFPRWRHYRLPMPWDCSDQWDDILSFHSPGGSTHWIRSQKEAFWKF